MTTMIERVAMAMWVAQPTDTTLTPSEVVRLQARAAIEAMREPTDEMIDALPTVGLLPVSEQRDYVIRDWRKMIDAALTSPESNSS